MDCALPLKTSLMWQVRRPVAVTLRGGIRIPPQSRTPYAWSNCCGRARAVLEKSISDELAFSLLGENPFYGTPLNPCAPDRVPGGSSSGSASAVACGLVDFALGTHTGGSPRVPASNCGIGAFGHRTGLYPWPASIR